LFLDSGKSLQHYHPKGCSACGVIFIGGSLEGAVAYIKSLSRDTGVATLVTLDFELETLAAEEEIQVSLLSKVTEELVTFETFLYSKLIISLQNLWRLVLCWKRTSRSYKRFQRSSFYYRIRRLLIMKKEMDILIKESKPIDREYCRVKYWDVLQETVEYVDHIEESKHQRILSFARRFRRKLDLIVEVAREKKYQEWLRLQSLPKPPRPILIKKLKPKKGKDEKWICYRTECCLKGESYFCFFLCSYLTFVPFSIFFFVLCCSFLFRGLFCF
jgi:hypothetical protein